MEKLKGDDVTGWPLEGAERVAHLIYFDGPLLTHYRDREAKDVLCHWCDVDGGANRWLVLYARPDLLAGYLAGSIPLREVIVNPVGGTLLVADIDGRGERRMLLRVSPADLPADYLPHPDSLYDETPVT